MGHVTDVTIYRRLSCKTLELGIGRDLDKGKEKRKAHNATHSFNTQACRISAVLQLPHMTLIICFKPSVSSVIESIACTYDNRRFEQLLQMANSPSARVAGHVLGLMTMTFI
jgi:hypothetical protein